MNKFLVNVFIFITLAFVANAFTMQNQEAPIYREKTKTLTSYQQLNLMACKFKKIVGNRQPGDVCLSQFRRHKGRPVLETYECNTDMAYLHYSRFKAGHKHPQVMRRLRGFTS